MIFPGEPSRFRARLLLRGVVLVALGTGARLGIAQSPAERASQRHVEPGDKVVVKVYRELDLSDTVTVTGDGKLVLAKVGTIDAARYTIAALTDTLRGRYGRFLRNPAVDLVVLRRISVNGEVARPNVYYVDVVTALRDVIARAGGVTDLGDDSHIDIVRNGERTRVANWQDDVSLASDLRSGDQIVVGKRSWLSRNLFASVSSLALVASVLLALRR